MPGFTRQWDASCPREWDRWEDDGVTWVIQDLAPEDDETALQILEYDFLPDEPLCTCSKLTEDPESVTSMVSFWRECLAQRMTLGCYRLTNGDKELVALNVCVVDTIDEKVPSTPIEGVAWKNVYGAMEYIEKKCDPFKYLNLDKILHALGLSVKREYRGKRLGSRILAAREPLSLAHGVKATATVFTGPASQKSAARCGFHTICAVSAPELADNGLNYPRDDNIVIKLMVKRFDE
ncbi:uncharacterized protein LOC123864855 [Maniola jurtina]|uniref:uncharacterized protein LOC123864855 n=1 Tax=Maniola jurtina TaxID=191418 RepID=UPI001E68F5BE|nr:uncharacterized protein LOC123864855 [Maniola jurtina]XP_045761511.1 uncharacterized protein LOC123864855 [Maniola jurtina]